MRLLSIKNARHRLVRHVQRGANLAESLVRLPHGLHLLDSGLLSGVRHEAADFAILDNIEPERLFSAAKQRTASLATLYPARHRPATECDCERSFAG